MGIMPNIKIMKYEFGRKNANRSFFKGIKDVVFKEGEKEGRGKIVLV